MHWVRSWAVMLGAALLTIASTISESGPRAWVTAPSMFVSGTATHDLRSLHRQLREVEEIGPLWKGLGMGSRQRMTPAGAFKLGGGHRVIQSGWAETSRPWRISSTLDCARC